MDVKQKLESEVLETNWEPLAPHFARGVLYFIENDLDLIEVAQAMATDDVSQMKNWLDSGLLYPPTEQQAQEFHEEDQLLFKMIIIEPYVLIQKKFLS